jgi:hypothetical protein
MSQILEDKIIIRLSNMVKDVPANVETISAYINDEFLQTIESMIQELAPAGVIVEVEVSK